MVNVVHLILKTFVFFFIFQTNYDWNLIKLTALLRSTFAPFSCNNSVQITSNEPHMLSGPVSSGSEAHDYGSQCLLAGLYSVTLEIPFGSAQPNAVIFVDSVSLIHIQLIYNNYNVV